MAKRHGFLDIEPDAKEEGDRPTSRGAYRAGPARTPHSGLKPKARGLKATSQPMPEVVGNSKLRPRGEKPAPDKAFRYLGNDDDQDDEY